MAEAIARRLVADRGLRDIEVASAGTSAWEGAPASDGALLVSMENGIDLNAHRARVLSREMVAGASLVLGMGPHHVERSQVLGGEAQSHLLTQYASPRDDTTGVVDPFGGDLEAYRATYAELEVVVAQALDRAVAERGGAGH